MMMYSINILTLTLTTATPAVAVASIESGLEGVTAGLARWAGSGDVIVAS